MERRDKTVRELMQKLVEGDSDQQSVKQEAEQQTEELTKQIKVLQDQLLEVSELSSETELRKNAHCCSLHGVAFQ